MSALSLLLHFSVICYGGAEDGYCVCVDANSSTYCDDYSRDSWTDYQDVPDEGPTPEESQPEQV